MTATSPQTAAGKVLMHFAVSVDGFVAGPAHDMNFMGRATTREGLHQEYIETTGAVLSGRDGLDSAIGGSRPYGGKWKGPIFVLTHHPEDARSAEDITFLSCPVEEAVQVALKAANGKNVEVFSPNICAQLLPLGLIDEIDLHIVPVLLGDGIRLHQAVGGIPLYLLRVSDDPTRTVDLRYRLDPLPADDE